MRIGLSLRLRWLALRLTVAMRSGLLLHVWPMMVLLLVLHVTWMSLWKLHVHMFKLGVDVLELIFCDYALI